MKIIGGEFGGRIIATPKGDETRPTTSQIRAAVFNICQNSIVDASFLDLFAGSGAMGLEALSRGCKEATFVENSREAIQIIRQNIQLLGVEVKSHVFPTDAHKALQNLAKQEKQFDICYLDPPYGTNLDQLLLLLDTTLLIPGGHLFIEESTKTTLTFEHLSQFALKSSRRMGDTTLYHFQKCIN